MKFKNVKEMMYNSLRLYKSNIAFTIKHKKDKKVEYENITYKNLFFIVNPYKTKIINKSGISGTIIEKCTKTRSLTIACKDNQSIKMSGLKLYLCPLLTGYFNIIE